MCTLLAKVYFQFLSPFQLQAKVPSAVRMSAPFQEAINSTTKKEDQEGTRKLLDVSTAQEAWLQERKEAGDHLDICTKCTLAISILLIFGGTCCSWAYYIKLRDQESVLYALVAASLAVVAFIAQSCLLFTLLCYSEQISNALCCLKIALIASANEEYSCKFGCIQCLLYTLVILCLCPLPCVTASLMVVQAAMGISVGFAVIIVILYFCAAVCGLGILLCLCAASSANSSMY